MDKINFPMIIDGPNFINRIIDMQIDKDIIANQLSIALFRNQVKELLAIQDIECGLTLTEFVCSKKLFGSGNNKFSQKERDLLITRLMREIGTHIEEVNLPGSSEKGVDNMVASKIESFAKNFENIILVSNDRDYVPTLKKMREQGTRIILIPLSKDPPSELINEAYLTLEVYEDYECLFQYDYPKYFINKDFTFERFRELISNADDRTLNQLRVNKNGLIYISNNAVGSQDLLSVQFRFETSGAYNQYVGPKAASRKDYITEEFKEVKLAWKYKHKVDDYIDIPVRNFLDDGDE
jgi:uncharacterized LabA/DUF88 family protein